MNFGKRGVIIFLIIFLNIALAGLVITRIPLSYYSVTGFVAADVLLSYLISSFIHTNFLIPIHDINAAIKQVSEGNLDYSLQTDDDGSIGELFRNYEAMRLRLKENLDNQMSTEQQNRELITNISHDLKTPITAIKGYVEGIMDGVADTPEKVERYVRTIYNKTTDMDRLINELTFYSGIDANRIPYNFHRLNVRDYFQDCIEELGPELESEGIELNYSNLTDPDTVIIGDPEQLKRVINNIIGNSIKYMDKPHKEMDIRILNEHEAIRVDIEDNGQGIASRDLSRIFERFYRTDASRALATGGSGIGLSIVKKIIEDHGGYVWATSKEREGTCIHFIIRTYQEMADDEQSIDHRG